MYPCFKNKITGLFDSDWDVSWNIVFFYSLSLLYQVQFRGKWGRMRKMEHYRNAEKNNTLPHSYKQKYYIKCLDK